MKMTNEEAVKIIESLGPDDSVYGWRNTADAFNLAIKALENRSKYENALELAVRDHVIILKKIDADNKMTVESLTADGMKYYKQKAGLEVADDKARAD
jgi:hypothetical protein